MLQKLPATKSPNPTDRHVGRRVRMRRKMLAMSQTKLADALGLTFQQVQKYENGTNRIGAGRLQQIAHALQVSISLFFEDPLKPSGSSTDERRSPSSDYVSQFLTTTEGLALAKAFMYIKEPDVRRSIVLLVKAIAGED